MTSDSDKGNHPQIKNFKFHSQKHWQTKSSFSKRRKTVDLNSTSNNPKYSRGKKTKFINPNTPRQDKIKRRVQNFKKFGKKVAAATIGDYLVNPDL